MGPLEIEYEGNEQFLKDELPDILERIADLYKSSDIKLSQDDQVQLNPANENIQLTTSNIATKLGASSSDDLMLSACAHLTLSKGKSIFTRNEILAEMKSVPSIYKESMRSNLTKIIDRLIKADKLNEPSAGKYALTDNTKKSLLTELKN